MGMLRLGVGEFEAPDAIAYPVGKLVDDFLQLLTRAYSTRTIFPVLSNANEDGLCDSPLILDTPARMFGCDNTGGNRNQVRP
uniref:Uncharacterized protein n=1 Tax=Candidatus Kentrum sp. LPFa TaxID=2126335 RepID=A0A450Y3P2_9GAMM|nr:MAG: hypothetical protein BECKLPF1236C_GA0070990_104982 [Candidatus Kentron sp. LPFa]